MTIMKKNKSSVSVILPTYNEAENIVPLVRDVLSALGGYATDIIVVDDHSPDGTGDCVRQAIRNFRWKSVRVLGRTRDRGLTNSIRDGIQQATGDIVVWMDCDFSHPPSLLPLLVQGVEQGYDAAVGSRFIHSGKQKSVEKHSSDSKTAVFLSTMFNSVLSHCFHFDFHDYTSGFIAVRRDALLNIPLRGVYGEYFIDFMVRFFRKGYRVLEIPYVSPPRRFGLSKTASSIPGLAVYGIRYLRTVISLI